jgi:hypothetical protein
MFKTRGNLLCYVKVLAVVASVFLAGSCSTAPMRGYTGPELPASQTALIRGASSGINIVSCDGMKVTSSAVSVLPGDHIIEMSYFDSISESYSVGTSFIKFTAEAEHIYSVGHMSSSLPGRYEVLVMDQTTGKRVPLKFVDTPGTGERMLKAAEEAIKEHPQNAEFWANKGFALVMLKRYEEALPALEKAISLKPDFAEAWSLKSQTLYELKRYGEALTATEKAIQLRPNEQVYKRNGEIIMKKIKELGGGSKETKK